MQIIRAPQHLRHDIHSAEGWATDTGTDFWLIAAVGGETVGVGAGKHTLDTHGWTTTSITEYTGSAGNFLTSASDDPSAWHLDSASDLILSPAMFGSYAHARLIQEFSGKMVTSLNLETYAQFVDATGAETASGFGFVEGGGSIITAADALAVIYSDGTNFKLRSGDATSGAGTTDNTNWHLWKIQITASGIEWFIDGSSQNSGSLLALETGEFPVHYGMGVQAGGTNYMKLSWTHIWYA